MKLLFNTSDLQGICKTHSEMKWLSF